MIPIVDTGPLVALVDRSDRHHAWAVEVFSGVTLGLVTCEAVIAETLFLCARNRINGRPIHALLENQSLRVLPCLADAPGKVLQLMRRYESMSLADGALLHLHETLSNSGHAEPTRQTKTTAAMRDMSPPTMDFLYRTLRWHFN